LHDFFHLVSLSILNSDFLSIPVPPPTPVPPLQGG
jgi:hypothetical protein